jgi:hypothetical protein
MIVIAAVVVALAIYTRVGNRTEVLAVRRAVLAGEQILADDLQVVSISSDDSFPAISAADRNAVVGQYAKVRLAAGSLLVVDGIQAERLVDPNRILMSVMVPVGLVPVGLREQSRLTLVVTPASSGSARVAPVLVEAVVAAVPGNLADVVGTDEGGRAMVALSVEVDPRWISVVGSAAAVSVGVLDPQAPFPDAGAQLGLPLASETAPQPATASTGSADIYGGSTLPAVPTTAAATTTLGPTTTVAPPTTAAPTAAAATPPPTAPAAPATTQPAGSTG